MSLKAETPEDEDLLQECREVGLTISVLPKLEKTVFSRVGHAMSTFLSEKYFDLDIPILPWAIPLALDQDLPNYDALCFDQCKNLWILEAKTSQTKKSMSTQISELVSEIKNEGIKYFVQKAFWYQKHYENKIKLFPVLSVLKEIYNGKYDKMNIIGFFISPNVTRNIGKRFETELNDFGSAFRRNVEYNNIISSSERIYERVAKDV
ncbi:MAG: hypothetical protein JW891_04735 [Candidatus Lokiarchaeota archaeon]|nr:hypothetical protein [Candidatus Lokiarchaeota archaeon]